MPRPKTTGNGRLRALECPVDGMIVYCSRGAVIRHGLPRCACGERLFFRALEDQLAAAYEHAHEHPDFAGYVEREVRSAQRQVSHVGGRGSFQCGGCSKFVKATNTRCGCGFHNDIRGNRNHGRWTVASSRQNPAIPF